MEQMGPAHYSIACKNMCDTQKHGIHKTVDLILKCAQYSRYFVRCQLLTILKQISINKPTFLVLYIIGPKTFRSKGNANWWMQYVAILFKCVSFFLSLKLLLDEVLILLDHKTKHHKSSVAQCICSGILISNTICSIINMIGSTYLQIELLLTTSWIKNISQCMVTNRCVCCYSAQCQGLNPRVIYVFIFLQFYFTPF